MNRYPLSLIVSLLFIATLPAISQDTPAPAAAPASSNTSKKIAENFAGQAWVPSPYNNAQGTIVMDPEKPSDVSSGQSIKVTAQFMGGGIFTHYSATPPNPLYIPGDAKKITIRAKISDNRFPVSVSFIDGWGREKADSGYMHWSMDTRVLKNSNEWVTASFTVPPDWVRPIAISEVSTDNYEVRGEKINVTFSVADIEAETDISKVNNEGILTTWQPDPKPANKANALASAPITLLQSIAMTTPEQGNVFATPDAKLSLQVRNWKPDVLSGTGTFTVTDTSGKELTTWTQKLNVDSSDSIDHAIQMPRYGLYTVNADIVLTDGTKVNQKATLAHVPPLPASTDEQRLASPYGLNYSGGGPRLFEAFEKAGVVWMRDYAFHLTQLRRAMGADHDYAGWPNFGSLVLDYDHAHQMLLPCLSALDPQLRNGELKPLGLNPDREWVRDISDAILSFPTISYWELSNEYDLGHKEEAKTGWARYLNYHRKFGELVNVLGEGKLTAVEQGRAGIFPTDVIQFIKSGAFDKIGVINSHYYCGPDAPELNDNNYNTGNTGDTSGGSSFFDRLRAVKRAAQSDGKPRQSWLTEFGWDNLAGPVVSAEEQAAYLQRGYLLSFAAGTDKSFWFYNFDEEKPSKFFDGCGLLTFTQQPKLAFSAMAGMTSILPHPKFISDIEAGSNTTGYVFDNDGVTIAGLWAIKGDGPSVTFQAKQLYDYLGNKIDGLTTKLGIAPVYAVGLDKKDPFYLQTAYTLESPHIPTVTAGDPMDVVIKVLNNRDAELKAQVKIAMPPGWLLAPGDTSVTLAPGKDQEIHLPVTVGPDETLGSKPVTLTITEGTTTIKTIPISVRIQRPFLVVAGAIEGDPGKTTVPVDISNRSSVVQNGKLKVNLPQGWQATNPEIAVTELKPGETRTVPVELTWKAEWKDNESAMVAFDTGKGKPETVPIIPNHYTLHKAGAIKFDGNLSDWDAAHQLPDWMLGSTIGAANAKVWLAWSPEGLYGAAEVHDSKGNVKTPREFWGGDVMELYISTRDRAAGDQVMAGDHQFWFVPSFDDNRVFVGQWQIKNEIPDTRFDLPGIKSFSKRTADGYVMEFFLPASVFQSFSLRSGMTIGLDTNLTIRGSSFDRQVFWPRKKGENLNAQPLNWGQLKLTD